MPLFDICVFEVIYSDSLTKWDWQDNGKCKWIVNKEKSCLAYILYIVSIRKLIYSLLIIRSVCLHIERVWSRFGSYVFAVKYVLKVIFINTNVKIKIKYIYIQFLF